MERTADVQVREAVDVLLWVGESGIEVRAVEGEVSDGVEGEERRGCEAEVRGEYGGGVGEGWG